MRVIKIKDSAYDLLDKNKEKTGAAIAFTASNAIEQYFRPNPELKKKKVHPAFAPLKQIYFDTWKKNNGFQYTGWNVVDASALKRLIKQLEALNKEGNPLEDLFKVIMDRLPGFYHDKRINAINNNLNGIIAEIKQGGNKTKAIPNLGEFDWRT